MQKEINAVIKKAIEQNWYNEMTTSDLQGVCLAEAMKIHRKHNPMMPLSDKREVMFFVNKISDQILKGIYDQNQ